MDRKFLLESFLTHLCPSYSWSVNGLSSSVVLLSLSLISSSVVPALLFPSAVQLQQASSWFDWNSCNLIYSKVKGKEDIISNAFISIQSRKCCPLFVLTFKDGPAPTYISDASYYLGIVP